MSATEEFLARNDEHAARLAAARAAAGPVAPAPLAAPPSRQVAVVACMDARLDVHAALGLRPGEAHVIRNAGGVVTDDVIRSLSISQRLLGTVEVVLIHHTDCGMQTFTDEDFRRDLVRDTGATPGWAAGAFPDLDEDVRGSIALVSASPFVPHRDAVRGFVYDVVTGHLTEVK